MTNAGEQVALLASAPAGPGDRRFAGAVLAVATGLFLVVAPFAKVPLAPLAAFIPIYQSALLINDLITAVFLSSQAHIARSRALALLAGAYLFTALMAIVHALTFPGLFAPSGLLGAGPQTTAWLYMFWHGGFPLLVIAYAGSRPADPRSQHGSAAIAGIAATVVAAVCGLAVVATAGQQFLPDIMAEDHYTPAMIVVVSSVWLLNLVAAVVLARRRSHTVLDLWLIVVMSAFLFDIALSAVLNGGRYDLGFYAGRICGLMAASLVLMALLFENCRLYVQLIRLHISEREKAEKLRLLSTIDPLTGIANRRAFDEALDQEWRRMMRHQTALSLLMIDVDCFKRFNDTYGHLAGDHCLRAVAQVLAGRARRAGELAARYGGEEFVVLLPHTDLARARELAEAICAAVWQQRIPHAASTAAPYVTISVGVACVAEMPKFAAALSRENTAPAQSRPGPTALIEAADHALYEAKTSGRNRAVVAGIAAPGVAAAA